MQFINCFCVQKSLFPSVCWLPCGLCACVQTYCRVNDCRWISRSWESYWKTLLQSPNGPYPSPTINKSLLFSFHFSYSHNLEELYVFSWNCVNLSATFPTSLAGIFCPFLPLCHCTTYSLCLSLLLPLAPRAQHTKEIILVYSFEAILRKKEATGKCIQFTKPPHFGGHLNVSMIVCIYPMCPVNVFTTV